MSATQRDAMLALAERCEAATGPDRELDLAIAKGCELRPAHLQYIPGGSDLAWNAEGGGCGYKVERYTASIDAAMTLVPEGWVEGYRRRADGPTLADCYHRDTDKQVASLAATPALALCAASLRARAAQ